MTGTIEKARVDHGATVWTKEFDAQGRAIFTCPRENCDYTVAIKPGQPLVYLKYGVMEAAHQTYTWEAIAAAVELGLWTYDKLDTETVERIVKSPTNSMTMANTELIAKQTGGTDIPPATH